jgi:hypothetical protein
LLLERFGLIAFGVSAEVVMGFGVGGRLLLGDCERELCIDPVAGANQGVVSLARFYLFVENYFFLCGKSICFR